LPLSTEISFNRTEKIISDLTDYCPTFGPPLSPNNENKFDLEAVLDNLQEQTTDSCVVPNQLVLDNANVSTNNIYDKNESHSLTLLPSWLLHPVHRLLVRLTCHHLFVR
jgi:hypothetical protein